MSFFSLLHNTRDRSNFQLSSHLLPAIRTPLTSAHKNEGTPQFFCQSTWKIQTISPSSTTSTVLDQLKPIKLSHFLSFTFYVFFWLSFPRWLTLFEHIFIDVSTVILERTHTRADTSFLQPFRQIYWFLTPVTVELF